MGKAAIPGPSIAGHGEVVTGITPVETDFDACRSPLKEGELTSAAIVAMVWLTRHCEYIFANY